MQNNVLYILYCNSTYTACGSLPVDCYLLCGCDLTNGTTYIQVYALVVLHLELYTCLETTFSFKV